MKDILPRLGLRLPRPVVKIGLRILTATTLTLTVLGALVAVGLRNDNVASQLLSIYPRYFLAMEGFTVFQKMEDRILQTDPQSGKETFTNIGVISIDEPQWPVFWDFIQSETAIRKSERNEPIPPEPLGSAQPTTSRLTTPPSSSSQGETVPDGSGAPKAAVTPAPQSVAQNQISPAAFPINFQRIKTILSVKSPVISAGTKPLTPPYTLLVLWPGNSPRRVYEFLSLEEFRLDLRRMMLNEIEEYTLWATAITSIMALVSHILRSLANVE
jgi:hypothetical protein